MFPSKISHLNPQDAAPRLAGFSIIEVLIVVAIIGLLLSIASPAYENYVDRRNYASTTQSLLAIQTAIDRFYVENNRFPESLEDVDLGNLTDAWGTPFYYLDMATYNRKTSDAKVRRDKKLKPVNSDYDLYSAGKDRKTRAPFTAQESRDDIVRCNNGRFIGYASEY